MSGWMKISKKNMPEDQQKVLIWFPISQHVEDAVLFLDHGKVRYSLFDGECLMSEEPTHWRTFEPPAA